MNLIAWGLANLRLVGAAAALLAVIGFFYWFADKIGDSRELDIRQSITVKEGKDDAAENEGRARARACHGRGPDWLWNDGAEKCERQPALPTLGR